MDQIDRPLDFGAQQVGDIDHVAHVDRLDHVLMVGVAIAEVEHQFDAAGHVVRELHQDGAEGCEHRVAIAAVGVRLVALQAREHRGRHVELNREVAVRNGGGEPVDLA